jgi:hypothetical protein
MVSQVTESMRKGGPATAAFALSIYIANNHHRQCAKFSGNRSLSREPDPDSRTFSGRLFTWAHDIEFLWIKDPARLLKTTAFSGNLSFFNEKRDFLPVLARFVIYIVRLHIYSPVR